MKLHLIACFFVVYFMCICTSNAEDAANTSKFKFNCVVPLVSEKGTETETYSLTCDEIKYSLRNLSQVTSSSWESPDTFKSSYCNIPWDQNETTLDFNKVNRLCSYTYVLCKNVFSDGDFNFSYYTKHKCSNKEFVQIVDLKDTFSYYYKEKTYNIACSDIIDLRDANIKNVLYADGTMFNSCYLAGERDIVDNSGTFHYDANCYFECEDGNPYCTSA